MRWSEQSAGDEMMMERKFHLRWNERPFYSKHHERWPLDADAVRLLQSWCQDSCRF